jgi:hypothetical protein
MSLFFISRFPFIDQRFKIKKYGLWPDVKPFGLYGLWPDVMPFGLYRKGNMPFGLYRRWWTLKGKPHVTFFFKFFFGKWGWNIFWER